MNEIERAYHEQQCEIWAEIKSILPKPTSEQQQLAAMLLTQAEQKAEIAQIRQANAALMLALAQTQTGGNDNVV